MNIFWISSIILSVTTIHHCFEDSSEAPDETCYYKGREYGENDTILIDEPCLSCTCRKSTLNCSLRVCTNFPDPPPKGCVIVHKKDRCCPQLICDNPEVNLPETSTTDYSPANHGCFINGSLYSEGSALSSSSLCEFCYCIKGKQKCIKPECAQPAEDCSPEYSAHSCCPTRYTCETERSVSGCWVNGTEYADGVAVPTAAACDTCYCIKNQIQCNPIRCTIQQMDNCYPVYGTDGCCPHSYNCSYHNEMTETTETTITTTDPTTTEYLEETTSTTEFFSTTPTEPTETTTFEVTTDEVEATTLAIITAPPEEFTVDVSSNLRMDDQNQSILERAQPTPILTNATRSEDDYDAYDYSEPKLPPSLPNLVIFPFVAADAVTKEEQTKIEKKKDDSPIYYDNFFSPPVETEGGFLPKNDPLPETATYESPPSITMPPKTKTEFCVSEGKEYKHGESTSLIDCISCVCFYGEVICQEVACPTTPTGCYRTTEKEENSCCGKISCDPVTAEPINETTLTLEPMVSETPIDAIRTEPAPELSIMSEILPFIADQQTNRPVSVNYKNMQVNYYPKHQITTTQEEKKTTMTIEETPIVLSSTPIYKPEDQTTSSPIYKSPLIGFKPKPTESVLDEFLKGFFETSTQKPVHKFSAKIRNVTTTEPPSVQVIENREGEEKETNSLSLDSVFHMLFEAETSTPTTTTLKVRKKTKRPVVKPTTPKSVVNGLDGILKLAGCNIYGRMYRVGKIITELTNPCLECMCTESGVQCSKIAC